jgi:hypothetical protein
MFDINLIKEFLVAIKELESKLGATNSINNTLGMGMK